MTDEQFRYLMGQMTGGGGQVTGGGAGGVRYTPVTPTAAYPYPTDYQFIHGIAPARDVGPGSPGVFGGEMPLPPEVIPPNLKIPGGASSFDEYNNSLYNPNFGSIGTNPLYAANRPAAGFQPGGPTSMSTDFPFGAPDVTPIPSSPGTIEAAGGGFDFTPTNPRDAFVQNALGRGITPMPPDVYQNIYNPPTNEGVYPGSVAYSPPTYNPPTNEGMYPTDMGYFPPDNPPNLWSGNIPDTVYNPPPNEFMAPPTTDVYQPHGFANVSPNETMYPTDMGYFPADQPPDLSSGNIPDTVYNPPPNEAMYPNYVDYPAGTEATYYPSDQTEPAYAGGEWPYYIDQFQTPEDTSVAAGDYPTPPGVVPDVLPAGNVGVNPAYYGPGADVMQSPGNIFPGQQPIATGQPGQLDQFGNPIPGTALTPADEAARFNLAPFGGQPGLVDQLRQATDWQGFVDTAKRLGISISDAVKAVGGTIGNVAGKVGGSISNFLNQPGPTPQDLVDMGYQPGQGAGSLYPGGVTGLGQGGFGVGGGGGSFFHGGASVGATLPGPGGYQYPTHGATPVAGAFTNLGGMGISANVPGTWLGAALDRQRLLRMARAYSFGRPIPVNPTRALVGGPPGSKFSQNFLRTNPLSYARGGFLPTSGPGSIVNPAAFGGVTEPFGRGRNVGARGIPPTATQ